MSDPGPGRIRRGRASRPGGRPDLVGVVLAGGQGRRIGGGKSRVNLDGRALLTYPVDAVWRAVGNVTVVAKHDSLLPPLPGVEVWREPDSPRHPLAGIVHALSRAAGRPVLVCPGDVPLVSERLLRALASRDPGAAPAVLAAAGGRLEPLLGCYQPTALEPLARALGESSTSVREAVGALDPVLVEVEAPEELLNVNRPEDLLAATVAIRGRGSAQPNVKS